MFRYLDPHIEVAATMVSKLGEYLKIWVNNLKYTLNIDHTVNDHKFIIFGTSSVIYPE